MKRIALYGGSFDPVHTAHLALARTALDHLQLDELRWIPTGHAWQKQGAHASAEHRAAMVAAAIEGEPRFLLERCELDRQGPSYTIDTLHELQASNPGADWYLVLGQDQYQNLTTWKAWQDLVAQVTLAVAGRGGQASGSPLAGHPHRVVHLPMPPMPVSATEIRARLAAGTPAAALAPALVPPAVASYIARLGLYRSLPTPSPPRS